LHLSIFITSFTFRNVVNFFTVYCGYQFPNDRWHTEKMTENEHDISTKWTDFLSDRILLLGQVTEKREKADTSHFLKLLLVIPTSGTFGFAQLHRVVPFAKPKEPFFSQRTSNLKIHLK